MSTADEADHGPTYDRMASRALTRAGDWALETTLDAVQIAELRGDLMWAWAEGHGAATRDLQPPRELEAAELAQRDIIIGTLKAEIARLIEDDQKLDDRLDDAERALKRERSMPSRTSGSTVASLVVQDAEAKPAFQGCRRWVLDEARKYHEAADLLMASGEWAKAAPIQRKAEECERIAKAMGDYWLGPDDSC